ncbi:MAG: hypothetical protein QM808_10960 [Steroidobacteraceae bacterium]
MIAMTLLALSLTVELPAGEVVADVKTVQDDAQSYALYLPTDYTAAHSWPVIFVFDPGARGLNGVERYQAAAEQYGYIVVCSNNARNGQPSQSAISATLSDVLTRFNVDTTRMYTAGMSGGARLAMAVALVPAFKIAGVIASSAGYPDDKTYKRLPFVLFETAGTEDFNHLEMRKIDHELQTPHHLAIFEGGHAWPPKALILEAVEWLELQAMQSGIKARDEREIAQLYARRMQAMPDASDKQVFLALQDVVADFKGLQDVSALDARVKELGRDKQVRKAVQQERDEDERETRMLVNIWSAEDHLSAASERSERADILAELRRYWRQYAEQAQQLEDSPERRIARRVLSQLSAVGTKSTDEEYLQIVRQYRPVRSGRPFAEP